MLTDEQRQLAAENHNLIYKFAKCYGLRFDEYYDILAIGLCNAAMIFDASLGYRFSTLAFKCMKKEYVDYFVKNNGKKKVPQNKLVYLYSPVPGAESGVTFFDVVSNGTSNQYSFDDTHPETEDFLKTLKPKHRNVIENLLDGFTEEETARRLGCSKSNVSRICVYSRKKWSAYAGTENSRGLVATA